MTSHHQDDVVPGAADTISQSPRPVYPSPPSPSQKQNDEIHPRVAFMCSFGGRILPRPYDNQLRYVGGDTRIVAVNRSTKFSSLLAKLSKLSGTTDITIKYQLPNEDLDALITVSTDEDVENMMEEYDRITHGSNSKTSRLRLFLFTTTVSGGSGNLSSIIDGQSKSVREQWFLDAINSGILVTNAPSLEGGRSEVSSIISEIPDYLFGFDNSDESRKSKITPDLAGNVSGSDPASPISLPDLPPVKTKVEEPVPVTDSKETQTGEETISHPTRYTDYTTWQHIPASYFPAPAAMQPVPVYYFTGPVLPGKVPAAGGPMSAIYIQRIPVGFPHTVQSVGQVHGGGVKGVTAMEAYEYPTVSTGPMPELLNQQAYYTAINPGAIPSYPATAVVQSAPELQGSINETKIGHVLQPQ